MNAILGESATTKDLKLNTSMQVLMPTLDCTSVPKNMGVACHYELHFFYYFISLYFIERFCLDGIVNPQIQTCFYNHTNG
jgi:hypothetical protein